MARHPVHLRALAALGAAAAFLLAGCGSADGPGGPVRPSSAAGDGGTHGAEGRGGAAGKSGGCGDAVLDLAHPPDGGVCVGVGRTLTVRLVPGKGPARAAGGALAPVGEDVFRGVFPGTAELSGSLTCPPAKKGEARCMIVGTWKTAVRVR